MVDTQTYQGSAGMIKKEGQTIDTGRGSIVGAKKTIINQAEGRIEIYNTEGSVIMWIGYLGLNSSDEEMYGIGIFDSTGNMVIKNGYLGTDGTNPLYGMLVNDGTNDRMFIGQQIDGF